MRRLGVIAVACVGVVAGAIGTAALVDDEATVLPAARPAVVERVERKAVPVPEAGTLLTWVSGGLPAGFAERVVDAGFADATVVLGDVVWMAGSTDADGRAVDTLDPGWAVPLDAAAFDCATWAPLVPLAEATAVCDLASDEALLGETSARLRGLGAGSTIVLDGGHAVRVVGVVDDDAVGAAELVLPADGAAAAGVGTPRYVLVSFRGSRSAAEDAIRRASPGVALRVRGPGETPWLRHGDAVLPQSIVKERYGEWRARRLGGGRFEIDATWRTANLVTEDLPVLGRVTCHRGVLDALRPALEELAGRGAVGDVDRRASGCWNPRTIAGTDQPSRHAWGIAVDLVPAPADGEIVDVLERWGFTWGGRWLSPDPVHFEPVRAPKA